MANKILNDEILSDKQLDTVAGGTIKEFQEILDAYGDALGKNS